MPPFGLEDLVSAGSLTLNAAAASDSKRRVRRVVHIRGSHCNFMNRILREDYAALATRLGGLVDRFVWQPVPMVGYHRVTDTLSSQDPQLPATLLYDKIRAMTDPPRGFIDLSRFHNRFTGQPFVNSFHYSGPFMAAMARSLMSCVRPPGSAGEPLGDGERISIRECEK